MTRVISGVTLAAVALSAIFFLPSSTLQIVASGVAALAAHEYVRVAGAARGFSEWLLILIVAASCLVMANGIAFAAVPVLLGALAWVVLEVLLLGRTIHQAGVAVIAPIYIGLPLGMLAAIHAGGGWQATVLLMATVVVSDSGQYYSGRTFGRTPLAPAISPKKTVEGAVGGVVLGTICMAAGGRYLYPDRPLRGWILVGLAVVVLGICGDLFESRLKRVAGMKDSSTLIPGHGGVLDRIDALLFAVPAYYLYLRASG
jgi:phosphatidate cytidylyltransferase